MEDDDGDVKDDYRDTFITLMQFFVPTFFAMIIMMNIGTNLKLSFFKVDFSLRCFTAGEEHSAAAVIVKERTFANSNQCTFPIFNAYPLAVFQFVWPGFNDIAGGVV